jgi:hypothetical protein
MSWLTAAWAPKAILALLLALAVSSLANYLLVSRWLAARDDVATATERASQAQADSKLCSDGISDLQRETAKAITAAREAAAATQVANKARLARADRILAAPAAVPGNDCASASAGANAWLIERGQK